jgi:hypothetical protein
MSKRTLMLAVALIGLHAGPSHPQAPTLCEQPLDDNLGVMYERISRLPGATVAPSQNPDFDVINLGPQGQLWNFTRTTHPAYPSVACRRIVRVDGEMRVETQLRCNAAKPQCDKLAADYAALDKQMIDALKRQAPKK